jgi:hypothetical protein
VARLLGEDCRSVAVFSARGVVLETVERTAWDDYRERRTQEEAPRPIGDRS